MPLHITLFVNVSPRKLSRLRMNLRIRIWLMLLRRSSLLRSVKNSYGKFCGDIGLLKGLPTFPSSTVIPVGTNCIAFVILHAASCVCASIFPVVVLRGHISSCLYVCGCDVWGLAKPLKQALYVGFISLTVSLLHKSIILCITTLIFYESMQDSSGLSAQF
jgi:hypothetical protein